MARRIAGNQIELGSYVYLFESPVEGMADCVITAHGGHVQERRFNLPDGKSVMFKADFNKAAHHNSGPIRTPMKAASVHTTLHGPRSVLDQLLGKAVGYHWDDPNQRDGVQYYELVQQLQSEAKERGSNWVPHFVSIRNRRFPCANKLMWLSNVIELVAAHNPAIVNFHSVACRGIVPDKMANQAGKQSYQT